MAAIDSRIRFSSHSSIPESRRGTWFSWLVFAFLLAVFLYAYHNYHEILGKIDLKTSRTVTSAVLLIGMTGLYFHASKFYRDQFYLFLSIAWLSNLIYLVFDLGAPLPTSIEYPRFRSLSMLLAIASDLPLYLASTARRDKTPKYTDALIPLLAILSWFVVSITLVDAHLSSAVHTVLATLFGTYVLFMVYKAFSPRIETPSTWSTILGYTFLTYAIIQPTFLFVFSSQLRFLVKHIMFFALLLKLTNAIALAVMLRDDFGQFRAEAERAKDRLNQRSEFEEIGLLTAGIEHELRTPLGAMNTKLDQMKHDHQKDAQLVSELEFLDGQRVRILAATRIINTLRSSQEYFSERMETVKVGDLARKSIKDLRYEEGLITDGIIFRVQEHVERLFVKAYPPLLEQAFVNILKNAIEAIRMAGRHVGEVRVYISIASGSRDHVSISFQDNGCGLPQEDIENLTRPGFSTKGEQRSNRGLGLFVCERVVKLHNGRLGFENLEKSGAAVSIILPRLEPKKSILANNK